jgi:hypothetical protein
MKKILLTAVILTLLAPAMFAVTYNDTITAIFGTGNPNGGWTSETGNNIQLALRAKNRTTGDTTNVNGVYSFATGVDPSNAARARWNFEFSINSNAAQNPGGPNLSSYVYLLSVDIDPTLGTNFITFNPVTGIPDNAYGNNSTGNGAGTVGNAITSPGLQAANNIAQNSSNIMFAPFLGDPNANGVYDFVLRAYDPSDLVNALATTSMRVIVGDPSALPDSGATVAMLGIGLVAIAGFSLRKRAAKV